MCFSESPNFKIPTLKLNNPSQGICFEVGISRRKKRDPFDLKNKSLARFLTPSQSLIICKSRGDLGLVLQ